MKKLEETKHYKILIVDDDRLIRTVIREILEKSGYRVMEAGDFASAMEIIYQVTPDLILLDVVLPDLDGYEICRVLRNDTRTSHIPIIMLTSRKDTEDKVAGLEAGADDYITKPFEEAELLARIKTHLRRAKQEKSFNPLTGLPGNILIEEQIKHEVSRKDHKFAVMYVDLDNFKAYNDVYGFLKGDEVIKFLAYILEQCVREYGNPHDFIGHIGGDDFIAITTPDKVDAICSNLINRFDSAIPFFYSEEDRKRGYIITKDRMNREMKFPIMTLSIAVVSNERRPIENHWQVAEIAAELKKYAKTIEGSVYVKDRRTK
ncbi:MAG: hypothetical protein PWQ31_916 [Eubacteriales bacterium]|nr:hypothetical protein [Eubacteriales bacterium]